jgi:hypothetical protein
MALFTDGAIAALEDLVGHESGILALASSEGIDLSAKLTLAQEEVGAELVSSSLRVARNGANGLSLNNVAVTAPLKLWHVFHTLELTYREACGHQLNDRYRRKWQEYERLSNWASETLFHIGVGIVWDPVAAAGAPELSYVAGPQDAATYFVRTSWINSNGEEGSPGKLATLDAPSGSLLVVKPASAPGNAAGWNVYAGTTVDGVSLQNLTPLAPGETWVEDAAGLAAGRLPGLGQEPNCLRGLPRVLQRG